MKNLELNWTISKSKDTYGYNVITLRDGNKKYRAMGGGYDMQGTVFAEWLWDNYKENIIEALQDKEQDFYGFKKYVMNGKIGYSINGACGLDCMLKIAKAIGLQVQSLYGRRQLTNFIIQ